MAFDYSKLRGRITEKFGTHAAFAVAMGLSQKSLSAKMTGKVYFSQDEMSTAIRLLGIDTSEINQYFFTLKVQ